MPEIGDGNTIAQNWEAAKAGDQVVDQMEFEQILSAALEGGISDSELELARRLWQRAAHNVKSPPDDIVQQRREADKNLARAEARLSAASQELDWLDEVAEFFNFFNATENQRAARKAVNEVGEAYARRKEIDTKLQTNFTRAKALFDTLSEKASTRE